MRILITGLNFHPEPIGTGKFTGEMADWLEKRGHDVRVVTAPPYYPNWRIQPGHSSFRYRSGNEHGMKVWRCPIWVPRSPSGLKRLVHLASFALSSLPIVAAQALLWKPDIILLVAPTLFCAPAVVAAGRISAAATWLHVQDLELDAALGLGILRRQLARSVLRACERSLLRRFDFCSTIAESMADRIRATAARRVDVVPNWTDIDEIHPDRGLGEQLRRELQIRSDRFVALYSGSMGEKQGLDLVVDAAARLRDDERFLFVLCGEGPTKQRLEQRARDLRNVMFLPLQPRDRFNALLNVADVHLLPQRVEAEDAVLPSKLLSMLASGRPVIATARPTSGLGRVVIDAGGVLSPPDDCDELVASLLTLAADPERREARAALARRYAEAHLGKNGVLQRFEALLRAAAA